MITEAIYISLQILALHILFRQGNLLFSLRRATANVLDRYTGLTASRYIQKPLWDCLPCMASVWTITLTFSLDIPLILAVCGCNTLLELLIPAEDEIETYTKRLD